MSIGTKLTAATLVVLVLVSALLYRELTRRERQSLLSSKETAATMVADLFAASLAAPLDFADEDAIGAELGHLEKNREVICAAVFLKNTPIKQLSRGCKADAPILTDENRRAEIFDDRVEVTRIVRGREDAIVGKTRVVFSLERENQAFAASQRQIFWLTFLLATGTAAVLIIISRTQIVGPLRRLSDAARRVGGGDLGTRVDVRSNDELGQLAGAFNRMSEEIGDRERKLSAATQNLRDLFDHMGQAIVAFDREGLIRGATSRQAAKLFGSSSSSPDDPLEGRSIKSILFAKESEIESQAWDEWLGATFDVPLEAWSSIAELAPKEAKLDGKELTLEFRPVVKDGAIDRVMMLATDVSETRRLEHAVQTQEEEHAKRMAAMRKLVAGGAQLFVGFIETARERVARFFELVQDDGGSDVELDITTVDEMFRHVHTMKGEARAFDLRDLEAALESLEDTLSALRKNAAALSRQDVAEDAASAIRAGLFRAEAAIERTRADFVAASPIGSAALEQTTVQRSDLEAALAIALEGGRGGDALAQAVARLGARPFGESLATIAERAPEWAARDGKRIELVIEGREVRLPPKLAAVLPGVMTHLVRNAVAHGVEGAADRLAAGKNEVGTIWASAIVPDDAPDPIITVEDDGAGIDLDGVVHRAKALGLDTTMVPTELVFHPGLSTRTTSDGLAGRGIGLDAVRSYLKEAGYAVHVFTEKGAGTKFVLAPA